MLIDLISSNVKIPAAYMEAIRKTTPKLTAAAAAS